MSNNKNKTINDDLNFIEENNSNITDNNNMKGKVKNNNALKILSLLVIILAIAASFLGYIVYDKELFKKDDEEVKPLTESILLLNSEIIEKDGEKFLPEYNKIDTDTKSSFVFGGKDINYEEKNNYKIVDLYVSFTGAKSVDTIWNNIESFEGAMSNGDIILVVHPIPTQNNIAVVMPQALAKSAEENSSKTWELFVNYVAITKANHENNGTFTSEKMRESMINSAKDLGYNSINKELLESTEFLSWIFDDMDNITKKVSESIPSIYVNGEKIDYKETSYVDTNKLFEKISEI